MPGFDTAAALAAILSLAAPPSAQKTLLMVKPGDPAATQQRAAAFLDRLGSYCREHVTPFRSAGATARIANSEQQALGILKRERPAVVLAPFSFYLAHLRAGQIVAQVPRFGTDVERFHVIVAADSGITGLADLSGRRVHRAASIDPVYLQRVVLPAGVRPGRDFVLHGSKNLSDDVFVMTEGGAEPGETVPDALIVDEELRQFLAADDLVWPALRVVWTSPPLPRDVVVALGDGWDERSRAALLRELAAMKDDPDGKEILKMMRSSGFEPPNRKLIAATTARYDAADKKLPADEERQRKRPKK